MLDNNFAEDEDDEAVNIMSGKAEGNNGQPEEEANETPREKRVVSKPQKQMMYNSDNNPVEHLRQLQERENPEYTAETKPRTAQNSAN